MKKVVVLAMILFIVSAMAVLEARTPDSTPLPKISLEVPLNNYILRQVPAQIKFKWRPIEGIVKYTLLIQVQEGNTWKTPVAHRLDVTGDHAAVQYNQAKTFRWQVGCVTPRGQLIRSPWWKVIYRNDSTENNTHRSM